MAPYAGNRTLRFPAIWRRRRAIVAEFARLGSLTRQELRVLLLAADGKSVPETAIVLGVSPGWIGGIRRSIRRKLAVPAGVKLGAVQEVNAIARFATANLHPDGTREPGGGPPGRESRTHLLLRTTIQELQALANRAAARAWALEELVADAGPGADTATEEARALRSMAELLEASRQEILANVRQRRRD